MLKPSKNDVITCFNLFACIFVTIFFFVETYHVGYNRGYKFAIENAVTQPAWLEAVKKEYNLRKSANETKRHIERLEGNDK